MTDDPSSETAPTWSYSRSAKAKVAVQRAVTALLDELAPEHNPRRIAVPVGTVSQHRTPSGCVLQAPECAVSVSWFLNTNEKPTHGELHVLVWRGTLARRGTPLRGENATLLTELVLKPVESPDDDCTWEASDGVRYGTASLAAKCLGLLGAEMAT
jgi:hypothetical protein